MDTSSVDAAMPYGTTEEDRFAKQWKISTGTVVSGGPCVLDPHTTFFLRGWVPQDGAPRAQVYFSDHFTGDWKHYGSALDLDGNAHEVVKIDTNVTCGAYTRCNYREDVGIGVPLDRLREKQAVGLTLSVRGSGGQQEITVPPAMIGSFLRRLDDAVAQAK